jgi:hypothetical protein
MDDCNKFFLSLGSIFKFYNTNQSNYKIILFMFFQIAECIASWKSLVFLHCCAGTMNYDTHFFPICAGDNYYPVPLWERKFCRNAYGIPWKKFCEKKQFIELYKNVMDWDDSGALENFEAAKERFRAKYHGEPFEDPLLDPDMYIDEIDHLCEVDPELVADLDKVPDVDKVLEQQLVANLGCEEPVADLVPMGHGELGAIPTPTGWGEEDAIPTPTGWGEEDANLAPVGWGEPVANVAAIGWGESASLTPDTAWEGRNSGWNSPLDQPQCTPSNWNDNSYGDRSSNNWYQQEVDPSHMPFGTRRNLNGGGRGSSCRNSNGGVGNRNNNLYGGRSSNTRYQQEVDPGRNSSGTRRKLNGGSGNRNNNFYGGGSSNNRYQQELDPGRMSPGAGRKQNGGGRGSKWNGGGGSGWQQCQRGRRTMEMEWRPVQHKRDPQDDPAA